MTPTKLRDKNKRFDVRKHKITWPVAPDGYIPNSVVRSLAPYPKFNRSHSCASKGLQVKEVEEDKNLILTEQLNHLLRKHFRPKEVPQNKSDDKSNLEDGIQSVPEETNIKASPKPFQSDVSGKTKTEAKFTPLRRGVPQRQYLLQTRQMFLQQNATSVEELQTNTSSAEEFQTNTSSAEELQMNTSVEELQTNTASVEELKNKEDSEKDFIHPPKIVPQSLSEKSNAYPTKQAKKGQKASFELPEGVPASPRLQQDKDDLQQEMSSSIKEQKSFQDSINKNGHVPKIGDPNENMRKKTNFSLKKLKSFVPPVLPMGDRRPNSVLMYLYKRSKAESSPSDGLKWAPKEAWTTIRY